MSCCNPPKLLSYYSNKINIYDSKYFAKLPNWTSSPAPSQVYIAPMYVYPPTRPNGPTPIYHIPQLLNPVGSYCGNIQMPNYNECCTQPNIVTSYENQQHSYCQNCRS